MKRTVQISTEVRVNMCFQSILMFTNPAYTRYEILNKVEDKRTTSS